MRSTRLRGLAAALPLLTTEEIEQARQAAADLGNVRFVRACRAIETFRSPTLLLWPQHGAYAGWASTWQRPGTTTVEDGHCYWVPVAGGEITVDDYDGENYPTGVHLDAEEVRGRLADDDDDRPARSDLPAADRASLWTSYPSRETVLAITWDGTVGGFENLTHALGLCWRTIKRHGPGSSRIDDPPTVFEIETRGGWLPVRPGDVVYSVRSGVFTHDVRVTSEYDWRVGGFGDRQG